MTYQQSRAQSTTSRPSKNSYQSVQDCPEREIINETHNSYTPFEKNKKSSTNKLITRPSHYPVPTHTHTRARARQHKTGVIYKKMRNHDYAHA